MTMLAHLSIQRCFRGQAPLAPSNEDRYRALRNALPVHLGNAVFSFDHNAASDQRGVSEHALLRRSGT